MHSLIRSFWVPYPSLWVQGSLVRQLVGTRVGVDEAWWVLVLVDARLIYDLFFFILGIRPESARQTEARRNLMFYLEKMHSHVVVVAISTTS